MRFRVRAHPPAPAVDVHQHLDAHYGGWADPLVIARAFLRADPDMAASAPEMVTPPFSRAVRWRRPWVRLGWSRFAQGVVSAG